MIPVNPLNSLFLFLVVCQQSLMFIGLPLSPCGFLQPRLAILILGERQNKSVEIY